MPPKRIILAAEGDKRAAVFSLLMALPWLRVVGILTADPNRRPDPAIRLANTFSSAERSRVPRLAASLAIRLWTRRMDTDAFNNRFFSRAIGRTYARELRHE